MPAEQEAADRDVAGMHVLILAAPAGVFTYGPFADRDGAVDFFNTEGLSGLDPDEHTAIVNRISPPVDLAPITGSDPGQTSLPLRHDATDADHRADGYLVVLQDGDVAVAFGAFGTRVEAETWWNTQHGGVPADMTATATPLLAQASTHLHLKNNN